MSSNTANTKGAKMIGKITLILAVMVSGLTVAQADDLIQCSDSFYAGVYPKIINAKLSSQTQSLCFDSFAVLYSGISRTPLWSAEHLTRERLTQAKLIDREESFHEETRLPQSMRANFADYSGSGYDRGQLAPNANMASRNQQYDSFSLANIAPQSPRNNRYIWRNIESATRYLTQQHGEVYTVTGAAFTDKKLKQLKGRVLVPSHFFKAVYIPAIEQAGVYYTANDESERVEIISLEELTAQTGIDVMPMLNQKIRTQALALPLKAGNDLDIFNLDTSNTVDKKPEWRVLVGTIIDWLAAQLQT